MCLALATGLYLDHAWLPLPDIGVHSGHQAPPLEEAYLDVTENLKGIASATQIAEESGEDPHRNRPNSLLKNSGFG